MASIFLAVGHGVSTNGNWDCGCVDGNYTEADLMLPIAQVTAAILRQNGVEVYSDADTGNDRNLTYTIRDANNLGVDVYVSLHCDWNQAPSGTLPIIYPGSDGGMKLANCINASVMLRMGMGTRSVLQRDDGEVESTRMIACIFETGSIRADIGRLLNYQAYGQAIAFGIMDYFGISYNGFDVPVPNPKPWPSPSNPYGFSSIYNSNYYLSYGDGPDENIRQFQIDCGFCGYWGERGPLGADALYGSESEYACCCVQRFHELVVDGKYGEASDIDLMTEIAQIQEALKKQGYDIPVDGGAGPVTIVALKDFQAKNGLVVDGVVGQATRAVLGI